MQNPFIRRATGVVALVAVAGLTACVTQPQQSNYPPPYQAPGYQNQGYQNQGNAPYGTEYGRVVHIESLQSQQQNQTSGAGAVIGAVVGGVLGNQVGKGGGRVAATALGAVGGAVVGTLSSILLACPLLTVGFLRVTKQDLLPKARDEAALARRP